jgi:branched-chain amino acid transport system permease protein
VKWRNWPGPAVLVGLALVPFGMQTHWILNIAVFSLMYAALASAWSILGGYAGYVSLGHAAFFGIGAYSMALLFENGSVGGGYVPFAVLPLIGVAVALASVPVAMIVMRTRATTFAIVTITFLFVVQTLAFNLHSLTHGSQGVGMPPPPFAAAKFERPFYLAMLALLGLSVLCAWLIHRSKLGLALFAIRDDEDKAKGVGIPVTAAKVTAFAVSVGITAMVGGVWAYYIPYIYPQFAVNPLVTIGMVLMAFLGGKGTLWGPVIGAAIIAPTQLYLAYELGGREYYLIAYAAVFLGVMLVLPRGILPSLAARRSGRRRGDVVTQLEPAGQAAGR